MAKHYHARTDRGLDGTRKWLARWYDHADHLLVEAMQIEPCPLPPPRMDSLRQGNQSELHTYLKCAAWDWLLDASDHPDTITSEAKCYSPVEEWCAGRRVLDEHGKEIDIATPRIIPEGTDPLFPLSYGLVVRIDLCCADISVEIGGTEPFNLLLPLLDGHVEQAVWLPYPKGILPNNFQLEQAGVGPLNAYAVRWRD
jgi:hypothetical protein